VAEASSPSSFLPGSVWCFGGYYTFLVLNEERILCLDDRGNDTLDVGRTFPLTQILKKAERVA